MGVCRSPNKARSPSRGESDRSGAIWAVVWLIDPDDSGMIGDTAHTTITQSQLVLPSAKMHSEVTDFSPSLSEFIRDIPVCIEQVAELIISQTCPVITSFPTTLVK